MFEIKHQSSNSLFLFFIGWKECTIYQFLMCMSKRLLVNSRRTNIAADNFNNFRILGHRNYHPHRFIGRLRSTHHGAEAMIKTLCIILVMVERLCHSQWVTKEKKRKEKGLMDFILVFRSY